MRCQLGTAKTLRILAPIGLKGVGVRANDRHLSKDSTGAGFPERELCYTGTRMEMRSEDLKALTQIGQALWPEPAKSTRLTAETLAAVSTLSLEPGLVIERTGFALLQRAGKDGVGPAAKIQHSFFRLNTTERVVLAALHLSRWSYERIGRLIGRNADEVAEIAWAARLELVAGTEGGIHIPHPVGSGRGGQHSDADCPDYHPRRPWTQTFLDNEISAADRLFLQNHLLACKACRNALQSARRFFYAAEIRVPAPREEHSQVETLERTMKRVGQSRDPLAMGVGESVLVFLSRKEVIWVLLGFGALLAFLTKK